MYIETLDTQKIAKAKERWSGLNDTDLRGVGNDSERLIDVVSRKGGLDREQARREVEEFLESCGCQSKDGKKQEFGATSNVQGDVPTSAQTRDKSGSVRTSGNKPATSTDDQTGEMASAGPGRKTRPDIENE